MSWPTMNNWLLIQLCTMLCKCVLRCLVGIKLKFSRCSFHSACYIMDKYASDFLTSGYLTPKQHELLRGQGRSCSSHRSIKLTKTSRWASSSHATASRALSRWLFYPWFPPQLCSWSIGRKSIRGFSGVRLPPYFNERAQLIQLCESRATQWYSNQYSHWWRRDCCRRRATI